MKVEQGQSVIIIPAIKNFRDRLAAATTLVQVAWVVARGQEARIQFTRSTNLDPEHPTAKRLLGEVPA